MKILHVITSLTMGGAEKLISDMVPRMKYDFGFETDILILSNYNDNFTAKLIEKNIKVITLKNNRNFSLFSFFEALRHMKNYDIIHSHLFPANYLVGLSKFFLKNKILITTEHATHNRRRNKNYLRFLEQYIYSKYDQIITISDKTNENLQNWLNISNNDRFSVIDNGIDLDKYSMAKPLEKSSFMSYSNPFLIAMTGNFRIDKDQATIVRALQYLPENIHLLLIGDGSNRNNLVKLTDELSLKERVTFMGFRNDVERILKTIDIAIVSSNWEGFGLVAVEAMAAKIPVIVSDVDGLKQVVGDGGIVFEKGNSKELASKILELMNNNDYYKNIAEKGFKQAQKYSIEQTVLKYLKVYDKLWI